MGLKEKRLERGYTQAALSQKSTVPLRTIQKYETGQIKKASAEAVYKLSMALGCTMEELIKKR